MSKLIKKFLSALLTLTLFLLLIWWTLSVDIRSGEGDILAHGAPGEIFIIKDDNPLLDFKVVYQGPDFTRELPIKSGDYALVMFDRGKKELYVYSDPSQMILRVASADNTRNKSFTDFGVWQLMFSSQTFFQHGQHSLTMTVR